MSIIQRLAQDIGSLLERELSSGVEADVAVERLYLACLLLIGGTGAAAEGQDADEPEDDDENEATPEPNEDDTEPAFDAPDAAIGSRTRSAGNPYLRGLLFRDYRAGEGNRTIRLPLGAAGTVRVSAEALCYVDEVLFLRRLEVARSIGERPTNLHLLLQTLCRSSALEPGDWANTVIRRDAAVVEQRAAWFERTAQVLAQQRERFAGAGSAVAATQRQKFGPFWLQVGESAAEVVDELTFRDVVESAPTPMRLGFAEQQEFRNLLAKVLDSLNTRYRLLRACGLPPDEWLHRDGPSIEQLKQLRRLRLLAVQQETWGRGETLVAYGTAFAALLGEAGQPAKVAGFECFEDWSDSEVGVAMLDRSDPQQISLGDLLGNDDSGFGEFEVPDASHEPSQTIQDEDAMQQILRNAGPRLAKQPALEPFFREILIRQRSFQDPDGLWFDPDFQALVQADANLAGQDAASVADRLFRAANRLIWDVLLEHPATTVDPVEERYIRWVIIEEKAVRGLLKHPPFLATLDHHPDYAALAPDERLQKLTARARQTMARLLSE